MTNREDNTEGVPTPVPLPDRPLTWRRIRSFDGVSYWGSAIIGGIELKFRIENLGSYWRLMGWVGRDNSIYHETRTLGLSKAAVDVLVGAYLTDGIDAYRAAKTEIKEGKAL